LLASVDFRVIAIDPIGPRQHRGVDGFMTWARGIPAASSLAASSSIFAVVETNANFVVLDGPSGGTIRTFAHQPSSPWTRRLAIGSTGRVLVAASTRGPWTFTPQLGMTLTGPDDATFLTLHDEGGSMVRTIRVGRSAHTLLIEALMDGRWAVAVANRETTPVDFVGYLVPPGNDEIIVLGPMLDFQSAHAIPFAPTDLATSGPFRVVVGQPGVAAFDDGGMRWARPDCGGQSVAASPSSVHVAEFGSGAYCGVLIGTSGSALRTAALDIGSGATISGTATDVFAPAPLATEIGANGDTYVVLAAGASICGQPPLPFVALLGGF